MNLSPRVFKPIYIDEEETKYSVNPYGIILNTITNRKLKWKNDSKGYLVVTLSHKGISHDKRVHALVATAFVENPNPSKFTIVNHLNGNKQDPSYINLEWTDYSGNTKHALATGLMKPAYGERSGRAKLTNAQVHEICKIMENGTMTQREIAKKYDVDESIIHEIRLGNNWRSISHLYNIDNCKLAVETLDESTVRSICAEIEKDDLTIKEIARKCDVKYDIVLGILNGRNYKNISSEYDLAHYTLRMRYSQELIDQITELILSGKDNVEIVYMLNLPKGPRTNAMLYRYRKKYQQK